MKARMSSTNRLGELLVREKLISLQQLRQAQEEQRKSGATSATRSPSSVTSPTTRSRTSSRTQYRVPAVNLDEYEIDARDHEARLEGGLREAQDHPALARRGALVVAMADPTNLHAIDDIKFLTGFNVEPVVSSETAIAAPSIAPTTRRGRGLRRGARRSSPTTDMELRHRRRGRSTSSSWRSRPRARRSSAS